MPHPDDFRPRKRSVESDLSATVPDIFAPSYLFSEIPDEYTTINLLEAGRINFPGAWKKDGLPESKGFYQSRNCLVAFLEIGDVRTDEYGGESLRALMSGPAKVLGESEMGRLISALAGFRPEESYTIGTASSELLCDRIVLVVQGLFTQSKTKEAFIVFRNGNHYSFLSLRAPKLEFPVFFNHLRHGLKTIEWR